MRRIVYQAHLILGAIAAVPVLAWSISGFLYALPNTVEGGAVENIDVERVRTAPEAAIISASRLAGRDLPITALTLLMKDGRPQYQAIGGLGADSIFVDAATGEPRYSSPPTATTRFFREAHFYFFAGSWQVGLLITLSLAAALSAASGIYLNVIYWSRKLRRVPASADVHAETQT